jgi:hypothetical protein
VSVFTPGVVIINPAVAETLPIAGVAFMTPPRDKYPDVVKVVDPSCNINGDVPVVLTLLRTIVIRFTQLGMLVKSTAVPLVVATAVPRTIFCVDDHTDPSAVNSTLPAVVGDTLAPSPP